MSGLPPLSAETGTPAHEWAAKTTSALDPNPSTPPTTTMNPTTRQLVEEKSLRPGTIEATAMDPLAPATSCVEHVQVDRVPGESAPYTAISASGTPAKEVPGAYPTGQEMQSQGQEITQTMSATANKAAQTASSLAHSVQETAATYLPKAAETVGAYLPKSVVDTVSSYVRKWHHPVVEGFVQILLSAIISNPQREVRASEHDKVHVTSLPSTELTGQYPHEHVDGVGALPGSVNESDVAKVPDERDTPVPTVGGVAAMAVGATAAAAGTAAGTAYAAKDKAQEVVGQAKEHAVGKSHSLFALKVILTVSPGPATEPGLSAKKYSLPSEEATGKKPFEHTDGAGALPGLRREPAVATLPDENSRGATNATSAQVGTHGRTYDPVSKPTQVDQWHGQGANVSGGVGHLPGSDGESGVAVLPDQRSGVGIGLGSATAAGAISGMYSNTYTHLSCLIS